MLSIRSLILVLQNVFRAELEEHRLSEMLCKQQLKYEASFYLEDPLGFQNNQSDPSKLTHNT